MDNISSLIDSYHPNFDAASWSRMRTFVCATVRERYAPGRSSHLVHNALTVLSGYGDWISFTGLGALDASTLRGDLIDAYTSFRTSEASAPVTERDRKVLRTLAGLPNSREHRPTTTRVPPGPVYTAEEVEDIRRWAHFQPTRLRQRDCTAIAALALGCGLTVAEMVTVRRRDIRILHDEMTAIAVGRRVIPTTAAWSEELELLMEAPPHDFIIAPDAEARTRHLIQDIVRRSVGGNPSPQRMRATWLLQHVDAGTPLNNLMEMTGLSGPDFVRRLLPFAVRLEGDAAVNAFRLRGEVVR